MIVQSLILEYEKNISEIDALEKIAKKSSDYIQRYENKVHKEIYSRVIEDLRACIE